MKGRELEIKNYKLKNEEKKTRRGEETTKGRLYDRTIER